MASDLSLVTQALLPVQNLLQALAKNPDFSDVFKLSFGDRFNREQAEALR